MAERSLPGHWFVSFFICCSTFFCGAFAVFCSLFSRSGRVAHRFARFWAKSLIFIAGIRVFVKGKENLPREGACIFIANHQSLMDIPAFFSTIPLEFRVLAKGMLFSIPFMGWTMGRAGYIPIYKDDPKKSLSTIKKAMAVLSSGVSLLIFPEGGRSVDGRIRRFKSGAFYLAIKAQAPIVPVAICGSRKILPKGSLKINRGTITLYVEKPIATAHRRSKERAELMEEVEGIVEDIFYRESGIR